MISRILQVSFIGCRCIFLLVVPEDPDQFRSFIDQLSIPGFLDLLHRLPDEVYSVILGTL